MEKSKYEVVTCSMCNGLGMVSEDGIHYVYKCMKCSGSGTMFKDSNTFDGSTLTYEEVLKQYMGGAELKGYEEGYAEGMDEGIKLAEGKLGTMAGMCELLSKRVGTDESLLKRLAKHLNKYFDCELRFKS